ncbi:MAG: hypothetical protein HW380_1980 [Magnetococcales bacterium]|nr:hypothetical protein [Magnetococcales bacterium]
MDAEVLEDLLAAKDPVQIYRELAKNRPDAFRPNLATSCGARAMVLKGLERQEEALASIVVYWFGAYRERSPCQTRKANQPNALQFGGYSRHLRESICLLLKIYNALCLI